MDFINTFRVAGETRMANVLKMAKIQAIQQLHAAGWSQRRIASELGIDRGTVARYLRAPPPDPKPAIPPAGSERPNAATFSPLPALTAAASGDSECADCPAGPKAAISPAGSEGGLVVPTAEVCVDFAAGPARPVRAVPRDDSGQARAGADGPADLAGPGRRARLRGQLLQRAAVRAEAGARARRCRFGGWNARRARKRRSTSARAHR